MSLGRDVSVGRALQRRHVALQRVDLPLQARAAARVVCSRRCGPGSQTRPARSPRGSRASIPAADPNSDQKLARSIFSASRGSSVYSRSTVGPRRTERARGLRGREARPEAGYRAVAAPWVRGSLDRIRQRARRFAVSLEAVDVVGMLERQGDVVKPLEKPLPDLGVDPRTRPRARRTTPPGARGRRPPHPASINARTSFSGRRTGSSPVFVQLP